MRLGYNTNGLQNHRLGDALRLLADHGYEAVGLTPDVGHLDPFHATAREVDAIAKLTDELGLAVVIETGARFVLDPSAKHEPTLMTRDVAARDRRLEFYARTAQLGVDLGAHVVSFWSGIDRTPDDASWRWLLDGVKRTAAAIRATGLVPALEPEPGMAIASLGDFDRLERDLGTDAPALTLDIGHLYVTEDEPAPAGIARQAERLVNVHLEDMRRGVHEHLLPGEGDVDFAGVFAALRQVGYEGPVCFELSRSSHLAPAAVELCRQLWSRHASSR